MTGDATMPETAAYDRLIRDIDTILRMQIWGILGILAGYFIL